MLVRIIRKDYASFVYLMADFQQLASAEVFVGTFSSNLGRLVALLRKGVGKASDSSLSLDFKWSPNRRKRSLILDGVWSGLPLSVVSI